MLCSLLHNSTTISLHRSSIAFTSITHTFERSAASTAVGIRHFLQGLHTSRTSVFIAVRTFASSRKKMPPKKAVKEEKILLGRPGNNLKSGIVCNTQFPMRFACRVSFEYTADVAVLCRLDSPMLANRLCSKPSLNVPLAIPP